MLQAPDVVYKLNTHRRKMSSEINKKGKFCWFLFIKYLDDQRNISVELAKAVIKLDEMILN